MRARRRPGQPASMRPVEVEGRVEADAVVSYNVAAIRRRRGWTQHEVARRLGEFTGHQLPKGSMSNMERGFVRGRRRRFHAHELYLLSVVFDVPIAYFFLPPPAAVLAEPHLADTGRPVVDLYGAVLGTDEQLVVFDERMGEANAASPGSSEAVLGAVFGARPDWGEQYRRWRRTRVGQLGREYEDRLVEVATFLRSFAAELMACGPRAYLSSHGANGEDHLPQMGAAGIGRGQGAR